MPPSHNKEIVVVPFLHPLDRRHRLLRVGRRHLLVLHHSPSPPRLQLPQTILVQSPLPLLLRHHHEHPLRLRRPPCRHRHLVVVVMLVLPLSVHEAHHFEVDPSAPRHSAREGQRLPVVGPAEEEQRHLVSGRVLATGAQFPIDKDANGARRRCEDGLVEAANRSITTFLLLYPPPSAPPTNSLKRCLSQTLSLFPLLAGRLDPGSPQVHCNDLGADFLQARADSSLSHLLRQPLCFRSLEALLPCGRSCACWGGALLAVQVTTLSCGGVAIGVCAAHKIADGFSLSRFVAAWAATSRGAAGDIPRPDFAAAASLFPPSEKAHLAMASVKWSMKPPAGNLVTRRFLFDEASLAALRGPSDAAAGGRPPTRVEAVAALVWRCALRARAASRVSLGFVVVDIRARMEPPLGERSFGNLCVYAAASEVEAGDGGAKRRTEEKLRNAIKSIDEEYLRRLRGVEGPLLVFEKGREAAREHGKGDDDVDDIDIYYFNSWARFPVYGLDFGWGKPVWVGVANFFWKNLVLLMGRRGDGGMEAWVTLEEEEMVRFEKDQELVSYAASLASIADY